MDTNSCPSGSDSSLTVPELKRAGNATDEKLLFKNEVFQVVGCAIEVLNTLGHGLIEKPYENALVVEFGLRNIPFQQQPPFDVLYKGQQVRLCLADRIPVEGIFFATTVIPLI